MITEQPNENKRAMPEEKPNTHERPPHVEALRTSVRFFYDLQKLRMQHGARGHAKSTADLTTGDKDYMAATALGLEALERRTLKHVRDQLKGFPIYGAWLKEQKGCGPTVAGVILSEVDITRCETVSALWAYAGLHVDTSTGKAMRRKRGEKANWNPFLKTKLVFVLGGCLVKANSPWRKFYDDYKHRKASAGWGVSDGHRHNAALRYMIKMFLAELWAEWRKLEGLPLTPTYAEAKLGVVHGEHASTDGA